MKPIIGIVGRCGFTPSDGVNNIRIAEKYRMCIIKSGGVPMGIMPPQLVEYEDCKPSELPELTKEEKDILTRQLSMCDGILLPGGLKRFEYDLFVLDYALKNDIPILGICLGMQIMTMLDKNGDIVMNLKRVESAINHSDYEKKHVHDVTISKTSKLYSLMNEDCFSVNSRHRMMVTDPGTFAVYGRSSDGIIELIERHDKKFALGVQWHPEMLALEDEHQLQIFKGFVDACRKE